MLQLQSTKILFISIILACNCQILSSCVRQKANPETAKLSMKNPTTAHDIQKTESASIDSIMLKRRNWENHGTDIVINKDGSFTVTAEFLGKSKQVRQGTISSQQLTHLITLIDKARPFYLPDEYKGPVKTEYSWWGYELTIQTSKWRKSIRFHSEDDTVPDALRRIVEAVMAATK